jgi:hypothetical protein
MYARIYVNCVLCVRVCVCVCVCVFVYVCVCLCWCCGVFSTIRRNSDTENEETQMRRLQRAPQQGKGVCESVLSVGPTWSSSRTSVCSSCGVGGVPTESGAADLVVISLFTMLIAPGYKSN